jgi:hypothetical protein
MHANSTNTSAQVSKDIYQLRCVTQVQVRSQDQSLERTIFNPVSPPTETREF